MEKGADVVLYRHTQRAPLLGWLFAALLGSLLATSVVLPDGPPAAALLIFLSPIGLILYLFTTLTVEVSPRQVRVWFGLKVGRMAFDTQDILACRRVEVPASQGYGIRMSLDGSWWLLRIWGGAGVQLQLKSGRQVTIVTDEPEQLYSAILRARYTP